MKKLEFEYFPTGKFSIPVGELQRFRKFPPIDDGTLGKTVVFTPPSSSFFLSRTVVPSRRRVIVLDFIMGEGDTDV
ncbi:MAG: hypothetical protein WC735_01650 [Candidatus Paceibacterota bacterium]|jgi:hypothetical protein